MSTSPVTADAAPAKKGITARSSHLGDRVFRALTLLCGFSVLIILVGITISTTKEALPAFLNQGLNFLVSARWAPPEGKFGALALIYGTVLASIVGLLVAVPLSLGIALFLTQVAPGWLKKPVVFVMDLLAAVPSVVFGLWGIHGVDALLSKGVYPLLGNTIGKIPLLGALFQPPFNSKSYMTAGLILGLMITPIITSISREVIETTPPGQKEAALALGATRWEMIRGAVLPHSRAGIVAAVMLGLGRAMGETIAVALVIGSVGNITLNLFANGDAMPAIIANQWGEAGTLQRSALVGLGLVLFVMTIVINLIARATLGKAKEQ